VEAHAVEVGVVVTATLAPGGLGAEVVGGDVPVTGARTTLRSPPTRSFDCGEGETIAAVVSGGAGIDGAGVAEAERTGLSSQPAAVKPPPTVFDGPSDWTARIANCVRPRRAARAYGSPPPDDVHFFTPHLLGHKQRDSKIDCGQRCVINMSRTVTVSDSTRQARQCRWHICWLVGRGLTGQTPVNFA
jgi:hypothetical protein